MNNKMLVFIISAVLLTPFWGWADSLLIDDSVAPLQANEIQEFHGGTPAYASEINTNFNKIVTLGINDNDSRIQLLEALITVRSINNVTNDNGNITITGGTGISVSSSDATNQITISTSNVNAATLDGIDSSAFLRSNTSDSFTSGTLTLGSATTLDANGTLRADGTLYVGTDSTSDNDYVYFDYSTNEYFGWNNGSGRFDLSDDLYSPLTITANLDLIANDDVIANDGVYVGGTTEAMRWDTGNAEIYFTDDGHFFGQYVSVGGNRAYIGDDGAGNDVEFGSIKSGVTGIAAWNRADGARMDVIGKSFIQMSSREAKEGIQAISADDAVSALAELEPVHFRYKGEEEQRLGFIAEDVPEIVATNSRDSLVSMDFVALLVKVVQDQQKKISDQEEKIAKLEKLVSGLNQGR